MALHRYMAAANPVASSGSPLTKPFFGPGAPFAGTPDILGYRTRPSGFEALRRGLARLQYPLGVPNPALGPTATMGQQPDVVAAALLEQHMAGQQLAAQQLAEQQLGAQQLAAQQWAAQQAAEAALGAGGFPQAPGPWQAEPSAIPQV